MAHGTSKTLRRYLEAEAGLDADGDLAERDAARASYRSAARELVDAMTGADSYGALTWESES